MNILIHTDEYYPTCAACAFRMKVFADTFNQLGHSVTVIASATNIRNGRGYCCKEQIVYSAAYRMKKKTAFTRMLNNMSFAFSSVIAALFTGKADVVITTSPPPLISFSGWVISKLKGAKLVYDVRDVWPDVALEMGSFSEDSFLCDIFHLITTFMYRQADIITTVSSGKVAKIRNKIPETMQDKVLLVGNGFDERVLGYDIDDELVSKFSLDSKFTCVYIGNVGLAQGLGALLEVAKRTKYKDVQFLVFGTGAERLLLEQRAARENLNNVRFCGVVEHEKVFTILRKAKISFIPLKSSQMKDSIPTKVYEALGLGCPVLLMAEGDACELIHKTGLGRCVSPDQIEQLPTVFDDMVTRYQDYDAYRNAAACLIKEEYSRQEIARKFERTLKKLTEM